MAVAPQRDGAGYDFADVHRSLVDRPAPHRFVGDQHVLGIEEQHPDFLDQLVPHGRLEIVAQSVPTGDQGALFDPRFQQPLGGRLGDGQGADHAFAEALAAEHLGRLLQ
jgi:hypothetical protein